jgi:hypothetical protein
MVYMSRRGLSVEMYSSSTSPEPLSSSFDSSWDVAVVVLLCRQVVGLTADLLVRIS